MGEKLKCDNIQQNILTILQTASGSRVDIAYAIYNQIVCSGNRKAENLAFFLEHSENVESSNETHIEKVYSEEDKYQYIKDYGKVIDGTLEALIKKNYEKEKFYDELWLFIEENPLLDSEKLKAFALYYIWIDARVPYFKLDAGIKMPNDEYIKIRKNMLNDIKKARFILNCPTAQKTERASRLVKMLDNLSEEKEKAVFMAQILKLADRSEMLLSQLANNSNQQIKIEQ